MTLRPICLYDLRPYTDEGNRTSAAEEVQEYTGRETNADRIRGEVLLSVKPNSEWD